MKTSVNLAGVELKNPVMTASGTFGSGAEYSEFVDLKELGAVVTKGVANVPWPGTVSYTHLGGERGSEDSRIQFQKRIDRRDPDREKNRGVRGSRHEL